MGNEQSAPRQSLGRRPANKLSKPKTNNHSSGITLIPGRSSVQGSRRNSISSAGNGNRLLTLNSESCPTNTDAGERPKGDPPKKKRMSMFRSKGNKKQDRPDVEPEVLQSFAEQGPNEQMLDRYSIQQQSRANSITTTELHYEQSVHENRERPALRERTHRWSTQQTPHPQQRNQQPSLAIEHASAQTFAPEEQMISRYDSKRTSTGLRSITNSEAGDDEYVVSRYDPKRTSGSGLRSRTNSETAIHVPIRRRSLQQHGVATRTGHFDGASRQSMPTTRVPSLENFHGQPQQSSERNPHQSHPDASQNRYNDIQEYNESTPELLHMLRPTPDFLLEAPRTETPTESDYGHIGAFKLGTLRIVNGAASPAPSEREPSIDGDKDDEDVLSLKMVHPSKSPKSAGKGETSGTVPPKTIASKMSWMVRSESPLHRSKEPETAALRVDTHLPLPLPDFSFDPFDFKLNLKNGSDLKSDSIQDGKTITSRSVEVKLQDSTQDVALSPFSFTHSPPITPQLETTSKHMAVEDSLFDAEPLTPIFPTIPRSDSKDSGYGPGIAEVEKLVKGPKEMLNKDRPLAKADSGYSSNISLRSFKKEKKETLTLQNQGSRKDELSRVGSGTASSFASSNSSETKKLRLQRSLPALPKQTPKVPSKESLRKISGPPVSLRKSSGNLMGKKERKVNEEEEKISAIPKAVYESFSRETSPAISELSTTSATSTAASTAPSTTSSRWRLGGKLKKESLPLQKTKASEPVQPFTVQAVRGVSEQLRIPKPSIEVRKNLEKREKEFPVNSFKNTLPLNYNAPPPLATQLRRTASKETLGTIFSVGSMEVREELGFARLQKSLPAVPVEQSIPEDPASSPTKEQFPRGLRKERAKPDMVQISKTIISTELKGQENNDKSISVEQPMTAQAPVKRPPRDWGRRSLAANFREKEAPVSPPRKEVKRTLGSASPQSPSKQVTIADRERDLGKQSSEPVAARLLIAPELAKREVDAQEIKQDLDCNPSSLSSSEQETVLMTASHIRNETNPVQKRQNDRQSLPSQLARLATNPTPATNSNHLSSELENRKASLLSTKTVVEPTRIAPDIPSAQSHQTPTHRSISTKISVPALRRLYQTPNPDPAPSMPVSDSKSAPLEEDSTPARQEPQRQEWRRRSSNASRERQKTSPDSEETLFTTQTKLTDNDVIQGPTDSHLITSIASYTASDSFKALTSQSSSETLLQPLKTLQSKKSQPSLTSNSSRRSVRAYPPQAHANRGPRSIFSNYQPPPAPAPGPATHIGSQLQDQTFYAQIQRRQSQEFEPASSSPKSERFGNKPPVSMTTRRNSVLVKSPPIPNPGQEYFALRNEETLIANAPSTTIPNVDPSWEPSQNFWSQRRRSAGNLSQNRKDNIDNGDRQQPNAEPSVRPLEQPQQTLHQQRSLNLRSDSTEPGLDYPEHGIFYRGRPATNIVEPPIPLESTMARKPSILRHSQPSETDLRSRRSMDVRQPQPSEQELARQSRSETNKQDSSEKRSKSVGFAPQPWEPAKAAAEHDAFVKKRQSMDRMGPNGGPSQPARKFSIDTLPSQTGQIGLSMRKASPSPISMPLGNRRSFDTPVQHTLQGSRRSFDVSQQYQNNLPPQPPTLLQGSRRSFDQSQATGWTQQQKLAWSAQSHLNHYPPPQPQPRPQPRPQAILGTDPEFAQNFPTIPKSISTYHAPTPPPAPTYYPPSPSTHFYPNSHSRALSPRSSNPQMSPALSLTSQEEMLILDRYSGGLEYNFEAGMGISGSVGTGAMGGAQGGRKSVGQREMYGVDLSDVPVMLRRVRVEN